MSSDWNAGNIFSSKIKNNFLNNHPNSMKSYANIFPSLVSENATCVYVLAL